MSPLLLLRICFDCAFRVLSLCQFDITDSGEYPLPPLQDPEVNVIKNMELAESIAVWNSFEAHQLSTEISMICVAIILVFEATGY